MCQWLCGMHAAARALLHGASSCNMLAWCLWGLLGNCINNRRISLELPAYQTGRRKPVIYFVAPHSLHMAGGCCEEQVLCNHMRTPCRCQRGPPHLAAFQNHKTLPRADACSRLCSCPYWKLDKIVHKPLSGTLVSCLPTGRWCCTCSRWCNATAGALVCCEQLSY